LFLEDAFLKFNYQTHYPQLWQTLFNHALNIAAKNAHNLSHVYKNELLKINPVLFRLLMQKAFMCFAFTNLNNGALVDLMIEAQGYNNVFEMIVDEEKKTQEEDNLMFRNIDCKPTITWQINDLKSIFYKDSQQFKAFNNYWVLTLQSLKGNEVYLSLKLTYPNRASNKSSPRSFGGQKQAQLSKILEKEKINLSKKHSHPESKENSKIQEPSKSSERSSHLPAPLKTALTPHPAFPTPKCTPKSKISPKKIITLKDLNTSLQESPQSPAENAHPSAYLHPKPSKQAELIEIGTDYIVTISCYVLIQEIDQPDIGTFSVLHLISGSKSNTIVRSFKRDAFNQTLTCQIYFQIKYVYTGFLSYFSMNFNWLYKESEFGILSKNHFLILLKHKNLNVKREELLIVALLNWCKFFFAFF
jgi:hypothetical protein